MEWNSQTLLNLSQNFADALSPLPEFRHRAETSLSDAADIPNYGIAVLRLLSAKFVDYPAVDAIIRESAAIHFTNHIKSRRWSASPPIIPDSEKVEIKTVIIPVLLSSSTTPRIQSQLIEAVSVIGKHACFVKSWPDFVPELITGLENATKNSDYASIHAILALLNSLSERFRCDSFSPDVFCYFFDFSSIGEQLWQNFEWTAGLIDSVVLNLDDEQAAARLRLLIECQRLCCRIFDSLTFRGMSPSFYQNEDNWMSKFKNYVTVKYSSLEDGVVADGVELVDGLRLAVCDILS